MVARISSVGYCRNRCMGKGTLKCAWRFLGSSLSEVLTVHKMA